ncbi:hypothetical protein STEG23_008971 [Scotinomys teguina]
MRERVTGGVKVGARAGALEAPAEEEAEETGGGAEGTTDLGIGAGGRTGGGLFAGSRVRESGLKDLSGLVVAKNTPISVSIELIVVKEKYNPTLLLVEDAANVSGRQFLYPKIPGTFCLMAFRSCGRWLGIKRDATNTDNLASRRKILIQTEVETEKQA